MTRWFHRKVTGHPSRYDIECLEFAMKRIGPRSMWLPPCESDGIEVRIRSFAPPAMDWGVYYIADV